MVFPLLIAAALVAATNAFAGVRPEAAIVAGGCFWCLEEDFSGVKGVISVETGYAGGTLPEPTYRDVSAGRSDHLFAVRILFDPAMVSYRALLGRFLREIDPTDAGGQFCERGPQHRAAIFPLDAAQARTAAEAVADLERRIERPVAVQLRGETVFWPAEPAYQDYARRYPKRYEFYRRSCEIDERRRRVWQGLPPAPW